MVERIGFYNRDEKYGWLSNFHRCEMFVDGVLYPTNEHYYQSQKASGEEFKRWIRLAPNPYHAMKAGRTLRAGKPGELKEKWDDIKLDIMLKGLRTKFTNPILRKRLLDTKDAFLFEDSPNDIFWGMVNGKGENNLGMLIMFVRDEINSSMPRSP